MNRNLIIGKIQISTSGERLQNNSLRIIALLCGMIAFFAAGMSVHAGDSIESAGDVLAILLPATAAGLTIGFRDGQGAVQFGESAALMLGVTYGLKYAIDEERPNGGSYSFPSAHTSISFCSAEFMRKRYGWEYGVPAYVAATFVGYSRVESREHYTHDVIAGAVIGIVSSYVFTTPFMGLQIQPDTDGRYWGLRLSGNW